MKKTLTTVMTLLFALCCGLLLLTGCTSPGDKTAKDYETIEAARKEAETMAKASERSALGDQGKWYIYDMRLMYEKNDEFFTKMRADMGDDFDSVLSNGDPIFVGFLPFKKSYRLYAGKPDEDHMLYPDWNYEALSKPQ